MKTLAPAAPVLLGKGTEPAFLCPAMANRHGLIAGATGTGKTMTLKYMAEQFSTLGVPVFLVDVKGDLSGTALPGEANEKITQRLQQLGIADYQPTAFPVVFWDVFGKSGHPLRTTVSEMGPLLLARLLDLNDTQESVLSIAFKIADDNGYLLLDLKDLRALLTFLSQNAKSFAENYGAIAPASVAAIQRELTRLEAEGGNQFFGEPAITLADLITHTPEGFGTLNMLMADGLIHQPRLYACVMLWLLSELFETLPEVGDADRPKLVLFLDEAHLLFNDMPDILLSKIKQVMLLIRSKGVGIYFITQNPSDIPDDILGQLGNRLLHALRVFSPKDQKKVRALADGFPENPSLGPLADLIPELGVGEALVSTLNEKGLPNLPEKALMMPASSYAGPITPEQRAQLIHQSPLYGRYETPIDRESAFEQLKKRQLRDIENSESDPSEEKKATREMKKQPDFLQSMLNSAMRAIGSQLGREIMRGVMGSITGRSSRRR